MTKSQRPVGEFLPRFFLLVSSVCTQGAAADGNLLSASTPIDISTHNGAVLSFQSDGRIDSWRTAERNILTPETPSGFWARDAVTGLAAHLPGHVERIGDTVYYTGGSEELQLVLSADVTTQHNFIVLAGYLENRSMEERAVDLELRFYCDGEGLRWARDVQVTYPLTKDQAPSNELYPFHGMAFPDGRGAFGLGVSIAEPAIFEFSYVENSYYVLRLKYGLSRHATGRLQNRANFRLLLYKTDPAWKMRSVATLYYGFHAEWYARRAMGNGMWLQNYHSERVPNPWDYAYRVEVGRPQGTGWKSDARQGVPTLEYLITGQRELRHLPTIPERYEDQIALLLNTSQEYTHNMAPGSMYQREGLEREVILNCALFNGKDLYRILPRVTDWGGSSLTFPMNPDPDLYFDQPKPTVGKITMEWSRWLFETCPFIRGLFVDSLFGWGRYFNCRTDHFPYARISLTYDPESKRPAITNKFANQEFLYALRDLLHPENRLLMGNGTRPGRFFNGMAVDILGSENPVMPRLENPVMGGDAEGGGGMDSIGLVSHQYRILLFNRMVAYQKPFTILSFNKKEWADPVIVNRFWQLGLFFGIWPGFRQTLANEAWIADAQLAKAHEESTNRYSPLLKQTTAAGWEPITNAQTDDPTVWIERYGDIHKGLFFTVMNTSEAALTTMISLEMEPLQLKRNAKCVELVRIGDPVSMIGNKIQCSLDGGEVRLIKIAQ